jgi:hypothetical protein
MKCDACGQEFTDGHKYLVHIRDCDQINDDDG